MKKSILFVVPTLTIGGVERVLVNLVNELVQDFDVTIITIYDYFDLKEKLNNSVTVKSFYKTSKFKIWNYKKVRLYTGMLKKMPSSLLYRVLVKEKYDVEIAFMRGAPAKIISGSVNSSSKKFVWVHSDFTKCTGIYDYFKDESTTRNAYLKFDKIICVSEYVKEMFTQVMKITDNCVVRYNINQTEDIKEKSLQTIDEIIRGNSGRFMVCSVGRLVEAKGYDRLLKVHKRLYDEGILYDLVIVGDGPEYDNYCRYTSDNGIEDSVHLIGKRDNPYKYMKQSDLFVCSSRWEGFSTVISEAVILGVPIVTTNVSGTSELLGNNEYGLITENTTEALYRGLKQYLTDSTMQKYYRNKVKERTSFFDKELRLKEIVELLG